MHESSEISSFNLNSRGCFLFLDHLPISYLPNLRFLVRSRLKVIEGGFDIKGFSEWLYTDITLMQAAKAPAKEEDDADELDSLLDV